MARIHTDLHCIPADCIPSALRLLMDAGYITHSDKDIRFSDIQSVKRRYPDNVAFIEVRSVY